MASNPKPKKLTKKQQEWNRKWDKPPALSWFVGAKELTYVKVYDAVYNEKGRPVCPNCGQYHFRTVEYDYAPPSKQKYGRLEFKGVCELCNTLYKYYTNLP